LTDAILVLNAGSSSIKFARYPAAVSPSGDLVCSGEFTGIGGAVRFYAKRPDGAMLIDQSSAEGATHEMALGVLLSWIDRQFADHRLVAAGHRVVHGGSRFAMPVRIDGDVVTEPSDEGTKRELDDLAKRIQTRIRELKERGELWSARTAYLKDAEEQHAHAQEMANAQFARGGRLRFCGPRLCATLRQSSKGSSD
jgi:Acetokinase family